MTSRHVHRPSVSSSVLIALVSTQDADRIFETLDALREQEGAGSFEVVIADRCDDERGKRIDAEYPLVQRIVCPPTTSIPELRLTALRRSCGNLIAVTEDHCVPCARWLASIEQAFASGGATVVAVGGAVENGVTRRAWDWATFLCEYSAYVPPVAEGRTEDLPGMNIAYRRTTLARVGEERLGSGFWETTAHGLLLQEGGHFVSTNEIRVSHRKQFGIGLFVRQRYLYSRYYAGRRFRRGQVVSRCLAVLRSVALPIVLLRRLRRRTAGKPVATRAFWRALPWLSFLVLIWAWGEVVGYLLGPGRALAEIE
jgi:hypothetical protein